VAVIAKLVPNFKVVPAAVGTPETATTTTTAAKTGGPATTAPTPPPTVFQVPGTFGPLTPVQVAINGKTVSADLLGPNSYEYLPAS
jgi:hypothetical protein